MVAQLGGYLGRAKDRRLAVENQGLRLGGVYTAILDRANALMLGQRAYGFQKHLNASTVGNIVKGSRRLHPQWM